jgi:putative iron-regulated protein
MCAMKKAILLTMALSGSLFSNVIAQDATGLDALKKQAAANYGDICFQTYTDALAAANKLQSTITGFISAPNQLGHIDARMAWIEARLPYLQSEAFRAYGGPIDKIESALNGPADAAAIDALISGEAPITAEAVASVPGGTGFHAIEYLLWGADKLDDGPGERSFVDYTSESPNATRRGQYLRAAGQALSVGLQALVNEWKPETPGNYRAQLAEAPAAAVLQRMLAGASRVAKNVIAQNRIGVPVTSKRGNDEQSPFSDTTHIDLLHNTAGVANVLAGAYIGTDGKIRVQGISPIALAEKIDPASAEKLKSATNLALQAAREAGKPFDQIILQPADSEAHKKLIACQTALNSLADQIDVLAASLGVAVKE